MFVNKKAISEIISYVLLTVLVIAIASGMYIWIKTYASNPLPEEQCPEISLIIEECSYSGTELNLTIINKGRYNVTGIIVNLLNDSLSQKIGSEPRDLSNYNGMDRFIPDPNIKYKLSFQLGNIDVEKSQIQILPIKSTAKKDYLCPEITFPISFCKIYINGEEQ